MLFNLYGLYNAKKVLLNSLKTQCIRLKHSMLRYTCNFGVTYLVISMYALYFSIDIETLNLIIMVIFKCYFSTEHIALSYIKRCEDSTSKANILRVQRVMENHA